MSCGSLNAFESELEDELWFDDAHRSKLVECVLTDELIDLLDLFICQPRISFRNWYQLPFATLIRVAPYAEGVIGEEAGSSSMSLLRVDQDGIDRERIDLPLPPVALC